MSFTLPYLLDAPYANLQGEVGFIYGSMCFLSLVWGYFFLPELKNRSLEELEDLFASGLPLRKFSQHVSGSEGVGAALTKLERLDSQDQSIAKIDLEDSRKGSYT